MKNNKEILIEISATPNSGKTIIISMIADFLRKKGLIVEVKFNDFDSEHQYELFHEHNKEKRESFMVNKNILIKEKK